MTDNNSNYKAGFVSILGKPNVGKSTLMNFLIGQKLSIITSKAQTTRHRILGIFTGKDFQIIYSDTPGIITPKYELHKSMIKESYGSITGADIIIWIVDIFEKELNEKLIDRCKKENIPLIILINKIDLIDEKDLKEIINFWTKLVPFAKIIAVSALFNKNTQNIIENILLYLPKHPPYYPEDIISDKPERFFVSEIIREKIFLNYHQEIPYSTEVTIDKFKEEDKIIKIKALIFVERESQKYILIGKKGLELKKTGTSARIEIEDFLRKKVFLELFVKVLPDWRKKISSLSKFGYR